MSGCNKKGRSPPDAERVPQTRQVALRLLWNDATNHRSAMCLNAQTHPKQVEIDHVAKRNSCCVWAVKRWRGNTDDIECQSTPILLIFSLGHYVCVCMKNLWKHGKSCAPPSVQICFNYLLTSSFLFIEYLFACTLLPVTPCHSFPASLVQVENL